MILYITLLGWTKMMREQGRIGKQSKYDRERDREVIK